MFPPPRSPALSRTIRSCTHAVYPPFSAVYYASLYRSRSYTSKLPSAHNGDPKSKEKQDQKGTKTPRRRGRWRPVAVFALSTAIGWYMAKITKEHKKSIFTSDGFVQYTLTDKEDVSSTCSIFTLKPLRDKLFDADDPTLAKAIVSVQFKQPQLQIARSYTLLPRQSTQAPDELRFLIRKEPNGEVSSYLHELPLGAVLELRGPHIDSHLPEDLRSVVFLAGGTGIAPALQVAEKLAGHADVHILWANRRREDCVAGMSDSRISQPRDFSILGWIWRSRRSGEDAVGEKDSGDEGVIIAYLDRLKGLHQQATAAGVGDSRLTVDFFVDEEGRFIQSEHLLRSIQSLSNAASSGKRFLFVSGPEGFVKYWAGPKQWVNGHEVQGTTGGVLSKLELRGWEVAKL